MLNKQLQISLNMMPSFYHKHLGLEYGEGYYFDPVYRAGVDKNEQVFIHDILGKFGEGCKHPVSSPDFMIQPVDLIMATQGGKIVCPLNATLETWGNPWAKLSIAEIKQINPVEVAQHQIINRIIKQYHEMEKMYGVKADILGIKAGNMSIHSPYTTAHQLCGEELFYKMVDSPEEIKIIFSKIWQIYKVLFARFAKELNAPMPTQLNIGDCSACMLSENLYRELVFPINGKITSGFKSVKYHSCGNSTHLLKDFAKLPLLDRIELGPGTDLAESSRLMPNVAMSPLLDPLTMRSKSPEYISTTVKNMAKTVKSSLQTTICAWSLDSETPLENLEALYSTVNKCNVKI